MSGFQKTLSQEPIDGASCKHVKNAAEFGLMPVLMYASFDINSQSEDCWDFTFLCFLPREIDFVKKEEELRKTVDEKDKWYKQQLEHLENKVWKSFKCLS